MKKLLALIGAAGISFGCPAHGGLVEEYLSYQHTQGIAEEMTVNKKYISGTYDDTFVGLRVNDYNGDGETDLALVFAGWKTNHAGNTKVYDAQFFDLGADGYVNIVRISEMHSGNRKHEPNVFVQEVYEDFLQLAKECQEKNCTFTQMDKAVLDFGSKHKEGLQSYFAHMHGML